MQEEKMLPVTLMVDSQGKPTKYAAPKKRAKTKSKSNVPKKKTKK
jgi:hypothetical protein